jgi:hypothetical protein
MGYPISSCFSHLLYFLLTLQRFPPYVYIFIPTTNTYIDTYYVFQFQLKLYFVQISDNSTSNKNSYIDNRQWTNIRNEEENIRGVGVTSVLYISLYHSVCLKSQITTVSIASCKVVVRISSSESRVMVWVQKVYYTHRPVYRQKTWNLEGFEYLPFYYII